MDYDAIRQEYEENKLSWENSLKDLNTQDTGDKFQGKMNGLIERFVPMKTNTND